MIVVVIAIVVIPTARSDAHGGLTIIRAENQKLIEIL